MFPETESDDHQHDPAADGPQAHRDRFFHKAGIKIGERPGIGTEKMNKNGYGQGKKQPNTDDEQAFVRQTPL